MFHPSEIARVVEMSVGQQNRLHRARIDSESAQQPAHLQRFADQPRVEKHRPALLVHEQVAHAHDSPNGVNPRRRVAVEHRRGYPRFNFSSRSPAACKVSDFFAKFSRT